MPNEIRDEYPQDPIYNDKGIGIADELDDSARHSQISLEDPNNSHPSSPPASTTEHEKNAPLPDEEPTTCRARKKHPGIFALPPHSASTTAGVSTGDYRPYAPSPPFEEAGPTSCIWRAYLDESLVYDTDMLGNQRGQVNILLVFAGLFSAIVSAFIAQSAGNLQPNYKQLSALLLFDQINMQRALANGTSLDRITTSGADPTAPFTPKTLDSWVNGLWFASLAFSLATALFAVLADEWYCHYLSPIAGDPQVRSRTRHLRYKGLLDWRVSTLIGLLPLMLYLSLGLFAIGLVLYLLPQQQGIALVTGIISLTTFIVYVMTNILPLIYPDCPYKTPLSSVAYTAIMWMLQQSSAILKATAAPTFNFYPTIKTLNDFEIHAAERSHVKNEVDALRWLYVRSSTPETRRLVIYALSGLPEEYTLDVYNVFHPYWDEIREEKERMLMDCMELTRHGSTRWIPKDIPNIDRRIEPLLRLEILFDPLRRKFPSGLFREHHLDFSTTDISDALLITLSSIEDTHINKPTHLALEKEVAMNALADYSYHHPVVWDHLLIRAVDQGLFIEKSDDTVFTMETCLDLVKFLSIPDRNPSACYSCTLVEAAAIYHEENVIGALLSFFEPFDVYKGSIDLLPRLLITIIRFLVLDSENSPIVDSIGLLGERPHTYTTFIYKHRLLEVALHVVIRGMSCSDNSQFSFFHDGVLNAVHSYIASGLFAMDPVNTEENTLVWTCRNHALACMTLFINRGSEFGVDVQVSEWGTRSFFYNIIRLIVQVFGRYFSDIGCHGSQFQVMGFLLGQGFAGGIVDAYDTFQEEGVLRHIVRRSELQLWLTEGLKEYIIGISEATRRTGNYPDLQSENFLQSHIEDLHNPLVVRGICASIVQSNTTPHSILSSLASIAPDHPEWPKILATLHSPDAKYSVEKYEFTLINPGCDEESLKKGLREATQVLTDCLVAANNEFNQQSTNSSPHIGPPEARRESPWRKWKKRIGVLNTDIEVGLV
ncbi:uncharacterized protein EV420DRAFT_1649666 [Desarmillaria tabescens]|uniref:DUF6535 domain-containing protein n=1 Tax=Armillaria tabescens TaxID=1929756 RepID=A0AA39MPN7_ARMTA|nr:uncharacterized protein EV420DRAFT_1649666 [Desarmillaria tabescens]KAK0442501.1 hypothetical protein EV420DRAFT_1649666 [Desarmillaria tabescens]